MKANQARYPVAMMCELLGVSRTGFYAWADRPRSIHARRDVELSALIRTIHERSHATYGAPRVHAELRQAYGVQVGCKRVARLMRAAGLQGVHKRRFVRTTIADSSARVAPDLVDRDFSVAGPNRLWVADATFIATWEGFLYLAIVLDAFSRRVVGWAMGSRLTTELMLGALERAYAQRAPRAVIHHSDRGSTYTAIAFGARCGELGVRLSMGSVGDAYDNAMAESFFATLECEVLDRERFRTRAQGRERIFAWLEGWYNPHRRHSSLGYRSPREFERTHERGQAAAISAASAAQRGSDRSSSKTLHVKNSKGG